MRSLLRPSRLAVLAVLLCLAWLTWHGSRVLPDEVASHFDLHGNADGWSSRKSFLVLFGFVGALMAFLGFGLPPLIQRTPVSLVNVPNRDYWLAPERKASTLAALGDDLAWCAFLTGALMAALLWRTIAFNLDPESGAMDGTLLLVGGYLVAMTLWTVRLFLRFRRTSDAG